VYTLNDYWAHTDDQPFIPSCCNSQDSGQKASSARYLKVDVTVEHDQCELMIVACMEKKWSYSFN
jgi:hypothetical protein